MAFLLVTGDGPSRDLAERSVTTAADALFIDGTTADARRRDRHSKLRIDEAHGEGNGPSICKRLRHFGQTAGAAERLSCSGGGA